MLSCGHCNQQGATLSSDDECSNIVISFFSSCVQVREHHRLWKEEGMGSRDVVIFAHGHFNRCLISRWIGFPLSLGA